MEDKKKAGNASQAEGVRKEKAVRFHLHGEEVKEEVVIHQHRPLQIRIGNPGPEYGSPNRRI